MVTEGTISSVASGPIELSRTTATATVDAKDTLGTAKKAGGAPSTDLLLDLETEPTTGIRRERLAVGEEEVAAVVVGRHADAG